MKMYVKPSIEVIELQLKENIAAVPTTVYRGSNKAAMKDNAQEYLIALNAKHTGLDGQILKEFGISAL